MNKKEYATKWLYIGFGTYIDLFPVLFTTNTLYMENNTSSNTPEENKKATKKAPAKKKAVKKKPAPKKRAAKKKASSKNQQVKRSYPRRTLEDALKVPIKIKEYNNGNAWKPKEVATAIELATAGVMWYYLSAASRDYGLTIGTRDTPEISITDLGRKIVYASNPQEEQESKIAAFFNVKVFSDVYKHYNGSNLPDIKYLSNTLVSNFDLDTTLHEEFIGIYKANCEYLGIENGLDNNSVAERVSDNVIGNDNAQTRIIAQPSNNKGNNPKLFVALPFSEKNKERPNGFFSEVINNLIIPAATNAGFQVETANKQGSDIIQSTIINELLDADLVLADLTDHNPNVLFELGFRIAANKPVIIMKAKGTGGVFDVDSLMRYCEYSPNLWKSTLEDDIPALQKHIEVAWEKKNQQSYFDILTKK